MYKRGRKSRATQCPREDESSASISLFSSADAKRKIKVNGNKFKLIEGNRFFCLLQTLTLEEGCNSTFFKLKATSEIKKKLFLAGEYAIVQCSLGAPPVPGCCLRQDAALDGSDVASHGES